ncbi:unnamed protein product [Calicophoron daubneyi]|uniref:G-protein coupled receptors family 1 profile domain-containing protein n=1 Tax=Calicophoron daubneyi TaxID=300641 RepID=A0AAV2T4F1_CALDB
MDEGGHPFENLHADLNELLPRLNSWLSSCHGSSNPSCSDKYKEILNSTLFASMSAPLLTSLKQGDQPCGDTERYSWMIEREYSVAVTMGLLGLVGLMGNIMSCVVIALYLLKFSGTFVLFLFLSLADSLVVIMQTIDAYRNSVMVDFYTSISPEEVMDSISVWKRGWSCKLFLFFWHLSLQLSAWLVMALSVERYASLKHFHLLRNRPYLYRRAWIIVGSIVTVLCIFNLPFLIYAKSVVYEMPCGLSHFCIFEDFHSTQKDPQIYSNDTWQDDVNQLPLSSKNLTNFAQDLLSSSQDFSRRISLWLSRQHLVIFGVIPYTVTFIFNMVLIHYLRSCPRPVMAGPPVIQSQHLLDNHRITSRYGITGHQLGRLRRSFFGCKCCLPIQVKSNEESTKRRSTAALPLISNPCNEQTRFQCQANQPINYVTSGQVLMPSTSYRNLMLVRQPGMDIPMVYKNDHLEEENGNSSTPCDSSRSCQNRLCRGTILNFCQACDYSKNTKDSSSSSNKRKGIYRMKSVFPTKSDARRVHRRLVFHFGGKHIHHHHWALKTWVGQTRTTMLLLAITFTFIGLTLPYLIYVELKQFNMIDMTKLKSYRTAHLVEELCRFLFFLNNGLNFVIYMTGRQFRKGFFCICRRIKRSVYGWCICRSRAEHGQWYRHPPNRPQTARCLRSRKNARLVCRVVMNPNQRRPVVVAYADYEHIPHRLFKTGPLRASH